MPAALSDLDRPPRARWWYPLVDAAVGSRVDPGSHGLILAARRRALLEDFGRSEFRLSLDRLTDSIEESAVLSASGRRAVRAHLVDLLIERLQLVDWVKKHPAISDHTIEPPVVITGVPGADLCGVRDRIAATRSDWPAATRLLATEARSGDQARPSPSTGPGDELFDITFRSLDFESALRVDRYRDALASSDFAAAYELHRVQLQILDAAHPGERRLVAGSEHLFAPHDLADAYPGAVVVLVDVDPDLALRRMVDQSSRRRGWFSDRVDEDCITGQWRRRIAELAGLVDPARDVLADRAFIVDVDDRSDFAGLFAAVR